MAKYTIEGSTLSDVADAVRELDGDSSAMTPAQMASRIRAYQLGADTGIIADDYDSTATYDVGDYCIYEGGLYECTTAIPTAEAWTAAHWTQATVGEELSALYQDISDLSNTVSGKYSKPSTGIPASDLASGVIPDVSGKADKVQNATSGNFASLDANGNLADSGKKPSDFLTEHQDLTDYVRSDDYATTSKYGVIIGNITGGVWIDETGHPYISSANLSQIKTGTDNYKPITSFHQDASTFYGLAKAAGDSTQSQSSNEVGTYTEDAKSKIHEMLDAPVTVSGTTPTITGKAGIRYICGEVSTLSITPPASGIIDVIFTSGSTPTVLTVPNTVKFPEWFDPTSLVANTTYEINIADGVYGAVMAWT